MDLEPDFTHIGYVDQQACSDAGTDSSDNWLTINVTEMDEEVADAAASQTLDTSFGKRHLEPLQIPSENDGCDKRGRTYIYDSSPTSHNTFLAPAHHSTINTVSPPANLASHPASLTQPRDLMDNAGGTAVEEPEPKISFMSFHAGSIALFVPVDAARTSWMAFHSGKPNRFLAEESVRLFTHRQGRPVEKTRILAKIVYIEERVVPYALTSAVSATSATSAGTGGRARAGSAVQDALCPAQQQARGGEGNPHRLPPGTVYFECFAEPVTVVKRS